MMIVWNLSECFAKPPNRCNGTKSGLFFDKMVTIGNPNGVVIRIIIIKLGIQVECRIKDHQRKYQKAL